MSDGNKPPVDEPSGPNLLDRRSYKLRFRTTLPSTRDAINEAVGKVMQVADEVGPFGDGRDDLEIALREALANAIIHGNKNLPDKRVQLRCYGAPQGGVLVLVRDEGPGFAPEEVPDPRGAERVFLDHGRGLFLMRELMDHVEHRKGGREVLLFKSLNADEPAPADGSEPEDDGAS